jgi:GDPmannose 4,6-dehydratase
LSRYYRNKFGLNIYIGYLFNHDSPLRKPNHFNQKVVIGIGEILSGKQKCLDLGNLSIEKEFGFSGDIVEAIWLLVNQNNYYEVVIGTGKSYQLKDWVEKCFQKVGLNWTNHVKYEESNLEYSVLVSNPELIKKIGWIPKFEIDDLVNIMLP